MDAVEYLKASKRICEAYETCKGCPLNREECENDCTILEHELPEEAVRIVEKWGKENPVLTRKDILLRMYPKAELREGAPTICPRCVAGGTCKDYGEEYGPLRGSCKRCKEGYWGKEV